MSYKNSRKGIILAGGNGSRLSPLTKAISKQLMPIYDKPMIYYPISTLMLANIRDIFIITTPEEQILFKKLLGDGSNWGVNFSYGIQAYPNGIAEAFIIAEEFIQNSPCALILGDNLFHGADLVKKLESANNNIKSTIFLYTVEDPKRYGIIEIDDNNKIKSIEEKPKNPKSNYAVTGLYFYDNTVSNYAKIINPSKRGELEITSINEIYLKNKTLDYEIMGRGSAWLDTGTFDSLNDASSYVRTLENRQGLKIGSPEEVAWRKGWINNKELENSANLFSNSSYGKYLKKLLS